MTDMQNQVRAIIAANERMPEGDAKMYPHEQMQLLLTVDIASSLLRIANALEKQNSAQKVAERLPNSYDRTRPAKQDPRFAR